MARQREIIKFVKQSYPCTEGFAVQAVVIKRYPNGSLEARELDRDKNWYVKPWEVVEANVVEG